MRRAIKLDVRINLMDEVEIDISSAYSPLPKHLLEDLADIIRKFAADNLNELTDDNVMPTSKHTTCPPRK